VRLPSGRSLREAKVGNVKMGELHSHLEKGAVHLIGRGKLGGILNDNSVFVKIMNNAGSNQASYPLDINRL